MSQFLGTLECACHMLRRLGYEDQRLDTERINGEGEQTDEIGNVFHVHIHIFEFTFTICFKATVKCADRFSGFTPFFFCSFLE